MKQVKGNLLDMFDAGDFDIIVHGCNCHKNMGGGIAFQIAQRYPTVEAADNRTVTSPAVSKLGTIVPVWLSNRWLSWFVPPKVVINAYTQYNPGRDGNLQAIVDAFTELTDLVHDNNWYGKKIGIPAIGCGIAGLEWEEVEHFLTPICQDLDITLVVFE